MIPTKVLYTVRAVTAVVTMTYINADPAPRKMKAEWAGCFSVSGSYACQSKAYHDGECDCSFLHGLAPGVSIKNEMVQPVLGRVVQFHL